MDAYFRIRRAPCSARHAEVPASSRSTEALSVTSPLTSSTPGSDARYAATAGGGASGAALGAMPGKMSCLSNALTWYPPSTSFCTPSLPRRPVAPTTATVLRVAAAEQTVNVMMSIMILRIFRGSRRVHAVGLSLPWRMMHAPRAVWKMLPSRAYGTTTTRNHTSRAYPPWGSLSHPVRTSALGGAGVDAGGDAVVEEATGHVMCPYADGRAYGACDGG